MAATQFTVPEIRNIIIRGINDWEGRHGDISKRWGMSKKEIASVFFQIAMAESGLTDAKGDTHITNTQSNESNSPWQINKIHTQYDINKLQDDPYYAFQAALDIADAQTDTRGDRNARFYDWTTHRLLDPNDQGPFQFQGGSRAPTEQDRKDAREKFSTASQEWGRLTWTGPGQDEYAPGAVQSVSGGPNTPGTTTKRYNALLKNDKPSLTQALGNLGKWTYEAPWHLWTSPEVDWSKLDVTTHIEDIAQALGFDALQDVPVLSDMAYDLITRIALSEDLIDIEATDKLEGYLIQRAQEVLINSLDKSITEAPEIDNRAIAGWRQAQNVFNDNPSPEALRELFTYANNITDSEGRPATQSIIELPSGERTRIAEEIQEKYEPWLLDERLSFAETQELLSRLDGARTQVEFDDITRDMDNFLIAGIPDVERPQWLQGLTEAETTLAQQVRDEQVAFREAEAARIAEMGDTGPGAVTDAEAAAAAAAAAQQGALTPLEMAMRGLGPNVTGMIDNGDGSYTVTFTDDFGETTTRRYAYEEGDGRTAPRFRPLDKLQMSATGQGFTTRYNPVTGQDELVNVGERLSGFTQVETYVDADGQQWAYDPYDPSKPHQRMGAGQTRDSFVEDRQFGRDVLTSDRTFNRDVLTSDRAFGEDQRQFNTELAQENYFNSLEEVGRNFRTLVGTAPEFANAATNQSQLISQILKDGGDFLARSYFTRGGLSPLPEITQADLINNLYDEANKIAQFEYDMAAQENQRITRANQDRAQKEFAQFNADQAAKAQTAYNQYKARVPSVTETREVPGGFALSAAERQAIADTIAEKQASLANLQAGSFAAHLGMDDETAAIIAEGMQSDIDALQAQYDAPGTVIESFEVAGTPDSFDQFKTTFDIPTPAFETWKSEYGFQPNPMVTMPQVPVPRQTSQAQLIANARATTPPAVEQVLQGEMPNALQFGGLRLPTFQQLQALTPDEREAMNTRLMTEFNVPLSDVAFQTERQFSAPSVDRNKDLARFRGYAV